MSRKRPGPPPKPIDADLVRAMARQGHTQSQIAAAVGVHQSQISRRYAAEFAAARDDGRADPGG